MLIVSNSFLEKKSKYYSIHDSIQETLQAANSGDAKAQIAAAHRFLHGIGVERSVESSFQYAKRAADSTNPGAFYFLYERAMRGDMQPFVPNDQAVAANYLEHAASLNDPDALLALAQTEQAHGNQPKAIALFKKAANANSPEAALWLGHHFLNLRRTSVNSLAYSYFEKSAHLCNPEAMFMLGQCYEFGIGVTIVNKLAHKYYKLAILHEYALAYGKKNSEVMSADITIPDKKILVDEAEAILNKRGLYINKNLVVMQKNGNNPRCVTSEDECDSELNRALELLELAAKHDQPYAKLFMGLLHNNNLYGKQFCVKKVLEYLEPIAYYQPLHSLLGSLYTTYGELLLQGIFYPKNNRLALAYLQKGAQEYACPRAYYDLYVAYRDGVTESTYLQFSDTDPDADQAQTLEGVFVPKQNKSGSDVEEFLIPKSANNAYHFLTLAADAGYSPAIYQLGVTAHEGLLGQNIDLITASLLYQSIENTSEAARRKLFELKYAPLAKFGDSETQYRFGMVYEHGLSGFTPNLITAMEWYSLSAAQSNPNGIRALRKLSHKMEDLHSQINLELEPEPELTSSNDGLDLGILEIHPFAQTYKPATKKRILQDSENSETQPKRTKTDSE